MSRRTGVGDTEQIAAAILHAARTDDEFEWNPVLTSPRALGIGADIALHQALDELWQAGWLPVDLWQITRRRTDDSAVRLVIDAIAGNLARYAQANLPDQWRTQLAELDATVWWDRDEPLLTQWARRMRLDLPDALGTVLELLAELLELPELPVIAPLPGHLPRSGAEPPRGLDQKVLGRVRALLAKAERTTFPEEAEALSAKAQELMNRYAFERAVLDEDDDERHEHAAASSRVWLDNPYLDAKASLVHVVAEANRCRAVQHGNLGFLSLIGDDLDLEITELLATSLLVQATTAMVAEGRTETPSGTRAFRRSFLFAYAHRIGERLAEAESAAREAADDPRLLPVLADRERVVDATLYEMFGDPKPKTISLSDPSGWHAGRNAADRADLGIDHPALAATNQP
ncbi:DUF2786 domain-containing protein [Tamaricihabitans halophyticus]|uniref:DUF2786 domain-containing protein n=1 Tax=Tamaricihabitans halophyticus TaxID=1262583 RepID=UPI001404DDF4|nr:DUF2786 domain-containing protein [Tamaricihabitans halophyticus]